MDERPTSAVPERVGYIGAALVLAAIATGLALNLDPPATLFLLVFGAAVPMWLLEWRPVTVKVLGSPRSETLVGTAFIVFLQFSIIFMQLRWGGEKGGSLSSLIPIAIGMSILMLILSVLLPSVLGLSVAATGRACTALINARLPKGRDLTQMLGWVVKCFFMPLMVAWAWIWLSKFQSQWAWGGLQWFAGSMAMLYAIDTSFAIVGYGSTSARIGADIRSVDRSLLGWLSALACYPPLGTVVLESWLISRNAGNWQDWVASDSWLYMPWALAIIALTLIYTWSSVVFGPRFSNLTNRGIITSGPYRWSKHPAYISKNLSWWMLSVPFIASTGWVDAVLQCGAMLVVNLIYWLRAFTEERHLMRDPDYRNYAAWISRNGMFRLVRVR